MIRRTTILLWLLLPATVQLLAQEAPHSDIEFTYVDGIIEIEPGAEGLVFEGEFGTGAFSRQASEPGFDSEAAEGLGIGPGDVIGFNVLRELLYWDGNDFVSPGDAFITIGGEGSASNTRITPSTLFANAMLSEDSFAGIESTSTRS